MVSIIFDCPVISEDFFDLFKLQPHLKPSTSCPLSSITIALTAL